MHLHPTATLVEEVALDNGTEPVDNYRIALLTSIGERQRRVANVSVRCQILVAADPIIDTTARFHVFGALNLSQHFGLEMVRYAPLGMDQLGMGHKNARGFALTTMTFALLGNLNRVIDLTKGD